MIPRSGNSGKCNVMLSRGPAVLEEEKAFVHVEANGPTQRVGCRQRQSRLRGGLHSGLQWIANKRVGSPEVNTDDSLLIVGNQKKSHVK